MNTFELAEKKSLFVSGHRMCAGCGIPIIVRAVLSVAGKNTVVANATGCLEVASTIYPTSAWNVPWIHNTFENAAATLSGAESAYQFMKKKGKIKEKINFIAFGGDGGTYDIGLQSLSGALERKHNFLYVCYDNEAYMNTGNQRSSATPLGSATSTTPAGSVKPGKEIVRKNLTEIAAAHNLEYVAQASAFNLVDLTNKVKKALDCEGPSVITVLEPCPTNWGFPTDMTVQIAKLAAETCFWSLYEIEDGKYKVTYKPREKKPIEEYLKLQKRFAHLFKPQNKGLLEKIQKDVDKNWEILLKKEKDSQ
ncbi:MAG: pyruvate ferredoxin oxidoreductase [Candidatus Aenigmarchaeota archaeon]|nr:pyruvate ferredoxin oxidoreductase [Candidatus Aenigmarchaeota archaeon]